MTFLLSSSTPQTVRYSETTHFSPLLLNAGSVCEPARTFSCGGGKRGKEAQRKEKKKERKERKEVGGAEQTEDEEGKSPGSKNLHPHPQPQPKLAALLSPHSTPKVEAQTCHSLACLFNQCYSRLPPSPPFLIIFPLDVCLSNICLLQLAL